MYMEKRYIILTLIFGFVLVGALSFLFRAESFLPGENEKVCTQVITRAKNPVTEEVRNFLTPCDVPPGWQEVPVLIVEEVNSPFNFSLHMGDSKKIGNLRIQLTDITDSRCPVDVQCVWAGEVRATINVSLGDKNGNKVLLLDDSYRPEDSILGYTVVFTKVTPGPSRANSPVDKKEYLATFYVIKEMSPAAGERGIIRGSVTIGPMCPVVRVGEDCPDKPYATTLLLQDQNKYTLKTITVPESGLFEFKVLVGSYIIVPKMVSVMPRAEAVPVVVSADQVSSVSISFDSGIR